MMVSEVIIALLDTTAVEHFVYPWDTLIICLLPINVNNSSSVYLVLWIKKLEVETPFKIILLGYLNPIDFFDNSTFKLRDSKWCRKVLSISLWSIISVSYTHLHDYAVRMVDEEVKKYKSQLEGSRTQYKIISEDRQTDGSIIIEIIKQYNTSPVGDYLK